MRKTLRHVGREWLIAFASYGLVVAPFGCQFETELLQDPNGPSGPSGPTVPTLNTKSAGLFLNEDTSDPLIVAGRNEAGDAFFVYGTRQSNGAVGEVNSILLKTSAGEESFIAFELGRPVLLKGPDGSYVKITYDEISTDRIAATAELYDASRDATETNAVDIDLHQTAQQVAQTVEELTGQTLNVPTVPSADTTKSQNRSLGPLLSALVVIPMVLLTQTMIIIVGQIMAAMMAAMAAALRAAVIVACWPLFLFAALLGEVSVEVDSVPLVQVFVDLPPPPLIDITIG
jgi:hypothetical protein